MKNSILFTTLTVFFTINFSAAQVVWIGGTPGKTTDWNVASNWNKNKIPTDLDDVVIPNLEGQGEFYPVITGFPSSIQFLFVESGAKLEIAEKSMLTIDGTNTFNDGILNFGRVKIKGEIDFINIAGATIVNEGAGKISNNRPHAVAGNF